MSGMLWTGAPSGSQATSERSPVIQPYLPKLGVLGCVAVIAASLGFVARGACRTEAAGVYLLPPRTLQEPLDPKMTVELIAGDALLLDGVASDIGGVRTRAASLSLENASAQVLLIAGEEIETERIVAIVTTIQAAGLRGIVYTVERPEPRLP